MTCERSETAEGCASRITALLDRLEANCQAMLTTIEQRQAARERMAHASQGEVFKAKRNYYHAVASMVRGEFGHQAVIEHQREAARTNGTTPSALREFECLVRSIAAGMSVGEYLEHESPQSWFARLTGDEQENE